MTSATTPLDYYTQTAATPPVANSAGRTRLAENFDMFLTLLTTQLKNLPREAVDRFLQKFGVKRIKDLPAAQLEKARAFVKQLAAELAPPQEEAETDPFA